MLQQRDEKLDTAGLDFDHVVATPARFSRRSTLDFASAMAAPLTGRPSSTTVSSAYVRVTNTQYSGYSACSLVGMPPL